MKVTILLPEYNIPVLFILQVIEFGGKQTLVNQTVGVFVDSEAKQTQVVLIKKLVNDNCNCDNEEQHMYS